MKEISIGYSNQWGTDTKQLKVFFAQADIKGQGYYRSQIPATALMKSGQFDVRCEICDLGEPALYESDIVVMQRQFDSYWPGIMAIGKAKGCKYVFEIDDDIFHLPEGLPNRERIVKQAHGMIPLMKQCDGIITATMPLARQLAGLNKNIYVLPNFIVEPDINIPEKNGNIRIGWSGSDSHWMDFDNYIINSLEEIKRIYGDKVQLIFMGWIPQTFIGKASFFHYVEPRQYLTFLRTLNFDIGIIPAKTFPFNQTRSNIKYLEYSINGAATIASSVSPYMDTITGEKGIVVKNKYKSWLDALQKLIEDESYRKQIAVNAYKFVKENYLLQENISKINDLFHNIMRGGNGD